MIIIFDIAAAERSTPSSQRFSCGADQPSSGVPVSSIPGLIYWLSQAEERPRVQVVDTRV